MNAPVVRTVPSSMEPMAQYSVNRANTAPEAAAPVFSVSNAVDHFTARKLAELMARA